MNERLARLRRRRERLALRAQVQRLEVGAIVERWRRPLALIDATTVLARRVMHHWAFWAVAFVVVARSRVPLGRWAGRIWSGWQVYRSLQAWERNRS